MLVDSHAHLDHVEDLDGSIIRAKDAQVAKIITIGTSIDCTKRCISVAEKYSSDELKIYATCGLHPKDAKQELESTSIDAAVEKIKKLAKSSEKVVAIGETGLDFYPASDQSLATTEKEKEFQRGLFKTQIELANELDLPLVIHCRNAWDEIFDLLSTVNRKPTTLRGVFHSWTGDWEAAQKALDIGFYISFSGIVTFKNASEIQEVAKKAPLESILIETDSPFLTPNPIRSEKNEPKNVKILAQFLASLRNQPIDRIEEATAENAAKLFRI